MRKIVFTTTVEVAKAVAQSEAALLRAARVKRPKVIVAETREILREVITSPEAVASCDVLIVTMDNIHGWIMRANIAVEFSEEFPHDERRQQALARVRVPPVEEAPDAGT